MVDDDATLLARLILPAALVADVDLIEPATLPDILIVLEGVLGLLFGVLRPETRRAANPGVGSDVGVLDVVGDSGEESFDVDIVHEELLQWNRSEAST